MSTVRIKRMFQRNHHGDFAAITVTFIARNKRGKEFMRKVITGKIGTDFQSGDYVFDIGGRAATEVSALYVQGPHVTLEWKIDQ